MGGKSTSVCKLNLIKDVRKNIILLIFVCQRVDSFLDSIPERPSTDWHVSMDVPLGRLRRLVDPENETHYELLAYYAEVPVVY